MALKFFIYAFLTGTMFIVGIFSFPMGYDTAHPRFRRDTTDDETKMEVEKGTNIMDDLQTIFESSSKILRGLIEIKTRVVGPILEGVGKTLDSINKSDAFEKSSETVATVGAAGIKASTGIVSAVTKSETTATTVKRKVDDSATDIGGRLLRLGICGIICPFQNGEERKQCFKSNCGNPDKKFKRNKNNTKNMDQADDV
jgi:hypothetical protein